MRHVLLPVAAALVVVPLMGCSASGVTDDGRPGIAASGSGGERRYAVANFDKVALGAAGDVTVRTGQAFGLTVTGAPADLDRLKVTLDGSTLGLGRKPGNYRGVGPVRWTVTMPRIAAADIGGAGTIAIDRVEGGDFVGKIGGSGDLSIVAMKVGTASFKIGGSGDVAAAGSVDRLDLAIGGSGKFRLQPLVAQTAAIAIAGAGDVEATVRRTADVKIMGSGDVSVMGGAKCAVTKMGGGTVRCG